MQTQKIEFPGHSGESLAARLDKPPGSVDAVAIFAHCFSCSKDISVARHISKQLADLGVAVLRFDFTGLGHSQGEFSNTNFSSNIEDLLHAANHLQDRGMPPSILIGHSLGGAAVLMAAGRIPSVQAVVTINAPADPNHVLHNFEAQLPEIESKDRAEVQLAGRPFTIKGQFVRDIRNFRLTPAVAKLGKALLVMHAPLDSTVGIENAAEIFAAAKHPKSFISLDKADHLITNPEDAQYAAAVVASWVDKFIPKAEKVSEPVPDGTVRVIESDAAGFRQSITTSSGLEIIADEPASFGGTGEGPTPYELLSSGLGACTAMTIRSYARRKNWPLDHVSVDIVHERIHAEDCSDCESAASKIDVFRRIVRLRGELLDEQRERLLQIAEMCPVHRTLGKMSKIETVLE